MHQIDYKKILEFVSDWVWEVDANDIYTYCSDNVYEFLGFDVDEVIGKTPYDFMSKEEAVRVGGISKIAVANKEPVVSLENTLIHKDGSEIIVETNAILLLDDQGELLGYQGIDRDISKIKRLKTKLEKKKALLREQYATLDSVINASPDLIFYKEYLNSDGTYFGCNNAYAEFVGKRKYEIIGRTDIELFGESTGNAYRTVDKDIILKNQTQNHQIWITYPNGKKQLVESSKAPFYSDEGDLIGVVGIARNLTDLHESTVELRKQKELFELIFKNTKSALLIINLKEKTCLDCNLALVEMFKFNSKEELLNIQLEILSPQYQANGKLSKEFLTEFIAQSVQEGSATAEWSAIKKNGEVFWIEAISTLLQFNEEQVLYLVISDISKRKSDQEELKEKQSIMIQQARLASMGEMIGNISHQWRQPLNALGLLVQKLAIYYQRDLLDSARLTTTVHKSMELINAMSTTIDDFRNFFNPNKEKVSFSIAEAINHAYSIVQAGYEQKVIDFSLEMEDTQLSIVGYPNELSQVILNLLANSKDVLEEKNIASAYVKITVTQGEETIYINVYDNGGGIPTLDIAKVFEPYFSTKEEGKGTGIGLYMSKTIIESHMDGSFAVQNAKDGAQFTITLPKKSSE